MPKLTLLLDNQEGQAWNVGQAITIGRLPDNTVVIDNPAVSGHHARVYRDGDQCVIEDLGSLNGTFVNEQLAIRQTLQDGDVVLVGKHKLVFEHRVDPQPHKGPTFVETLSKPANPELGSTKFLDSAEHRELLVKIGILTEADAAAPASGPSDATTAAGILCVLDGGADQSEYQLDAQMSIIGTSPTALVRLKGWFKPKMAVSIARKGDRYVATALGGETLINDKRLSDSQDLRDGDILRVSGLTLEFRLRT